MQRVSYGGLEFEVVKTNSYVREPVLSDDGTELLFMRTTYDLTMVFNPSCTSYAGGPGAQTAVEGATAGQTDASIRYLMLTPRLPFILVSDDGDPLLTVPVLGLDRDPDNGPKPLGCTVAAVGPKTWRVNWRVAVATIECGADSLGNLPPILSNRFSQAQETGLDRLTRVTTRGVTMFNAAALANANQTADFYRNQCIPACALNFQRQAVQVQVNTAGTALAWTVVDQELFTSIGDTGDPTRGTVEKFEASFSMRSGAPDQGGKPTQWLMARFDGFAWGSRDSSRQAMLGWLARLAIERAAIPNGQIDPTTQPMILSTTASEKLDAPFVELHIDLQYPPAKQAKQGLGVLRFDFLGIDLIKSFSNDGRNPQMPGDGNTRGSANVLALVAAIKDACGGVPNLPTDALGAVAGTTDSYLASTTDVQVNISDDLPDNVTNYSTDATTNGTYTEMTVGTRWSTSTGKYQAAIAGVVDSNGGSSSNDGTSNPTCEILQLGLPKTEVVVTFEAERASTPPIIPSPNTSLGNLVLIDEEVMPLAVGLGPDGLTPVYRIGGVYKYGALIARKPGAAIPFGVHPWTSFNYSDGGSSLAATSIVNGIFDPVAAVPT